MKEPPPLSLRTEMRRFESGEIKLYELIALILKARDEQWKSLIKNDK
jgi:hypothetical protein